MTRIITLGEIMLRLTPPDLERYLQSPRFDATFGGGESNTAVSLAHLGLDVAFVTALPANPIGDACIRFLRQYGVDTSLIHRGGERMGIYFLEVGANQRPSQVVYDRANSAISQVDQTAFDWDRIFSGASWFHITGITAAISQSAADVAIAACHAAAERRITISCDTSYRSKLWQYGKEPVDIMPTIAQHTNVLFANLDDCAFSYGVALTEDEMAGKSELDCNQMIGERMFSQFSSLRYQLFSHREGFSASHNAWGASMYNGRSLLTSPRYDITHIVDRVGGGDAFAAGLIYGLSTGFNDQLILDFAAASATLKHSIPGDVNLVTVPEIMQLMEGNVSGRVQR